MLLNSDTLKVFLFFMAEVTINEPGFQHGKKRGIFLISAQGSMAAKVWSSDASFSKGHCSDGLHVPRPNKGNVAIPYEDDAVTIPWRAIVRVGEWWKNWARLLGNDCIMVYIYIMIIIIIYYYFFLNIYIWLLLWLYEKYNELQSRSLHRMVQRSDFKSNDLT